MLIYNELTESYLSKKLTPTKDKSKAIDLRLIHDNDEFSFLNKDGKYLMFVKTGGNLTLQFGVGKVAFFMLENKYIYVLHDGNEYFLTFSEREVFFAKREAQEAQEAQEGQKNAKKGKKVKGNNVETEVVEKYPNQMVKLVRMSGICSKSYFHGNKYKGIITDLKYRVRVDALDSIFKKHSLYNSEDRAAFFGGKNPYSGEEETNLFNLCEPCIDPEKRDKICEESLGLIFSVGMYDEPHLEDENEEFCILHFSPRLLENKYYHLNTTSNNGFIISKKKGKGEKTYTDDNIKELTHDMCISRAHGKKKFYNFELVVRESVEEQYLTYITFYNLQKYQELYNKYPCVYHQNKESEKKKQRE